MFWLSKFFTKGKSIDDAVKFFTKINGRPPSGIENIKIKLAFGEANRPTNVIEFPKDKITDWTKTKTAKEKHFTDIADVDEREMRMADPKFDALMSLSDKHSKEIKALTPDKYPGMSFYHEMNQMMKRQKKEKLQFEYDEFFEKISEKSKRVDMDPRILLEAELGQKLTGRETTDMILEIFKNRPKKAQGGRIGSGLNYLLGEDDQNVRVPFKKGHSAGRRKFLQGIAALATIPIVGKYFKWAKPLAKTSKTLTQVPIKDISGMPYWFKPLVNKVIKEGDDVTKNYATLDRQIVHQSTLPDSKTPITVTQDLTSGDVAVDIGMGKHGFPHGKFGQPVRLEYKAAEDIMSGPSDEPFKVGVRDPLLREKVSIHEDLVKDIKPGKEGLHLKPGKTKEEFWVEEAEFTGGHPENIKFEESTFEKYGRHQSDLTEVEKFATGKIKKKPSGAPEAQGKGEPDFDSDLIDDYIKDDFASGGRVPLAGGGPTLKFLAKIFGKDRVSEIKKMDPEMYQGLLEVTPMFRSRNKKAMIDYMEKYLPHKSRTEIEEFILGADDDVIGNLIRLGSGRDYKGKIDMLKKIEKANRLRDFDVTGRKPNASGGLAGMLGE